VVGNGCSHRGRAQGAARIIKVNEVFTSRCICPNLRKTNHVGSTAWVIKGLAVRPLHSGEESGEKGVCERFQITCFSPG